ncbi:hypothetical protein EG329_004186 [Mollisiaceae sp. DMI_Dod_QoI]|nr:hypothetical protein EG329_004186 [Helotiales sp. DMI_Dod_QoI]
MRADLEKQAMEQEFIEPDAPCAPVLDGDTVSRHPTSVDDASVDSAPRNGTAQAMLQEPLGYYEHFQVLVQSAREDSKVLDPISKDFNETVGMLYRHNVSHTKTKLLKWAVVERLAHVDDEALLPISYLYNDMLSKFDNEKLRIDLEDHARAMRNFKEWESEKNPLRKDVDVNIMVPHAVLACAEYHNLWSGEEGAEVIFKNARQMADFGPAHVYDTRSQNKERGWAAFLSRFYMALFGGLALIVPMLIMTLHESKVTSLVTTSVFVIAVAVLLAGFMEDADPKDILAATAAYAAVLVVFVGTGTSSGG